MTTKLATVVMTMAMTMTMAAGTAAAKPVSYDCKMQSDEKYNWSAPRMLIFVDHEEKVAGVMDGIIASVSKTPMVVDYDPRSKERLKLKWTLNNLDARSGSAKVSYSATMDERRMKLSVTARVHGYDNRPSGSGTCVRSNIPMKR